MITTLEQMAEKVKALGKKRRIAIAWAQDSNTIGAVHKAVENGFAEALMIGKPAEITDACRTAGIDEKLFTIIPSDNDFKASREAVMLAKNGEADIVMKGLVGTDVFLKAVMDKENGLMLPDAVLSYVGAMEIPAYHKLLFITDPAVIPFPDLDQTLRVVDRDRVRTGSRGFGADATARA